MNFKGAQYANAKPLIFLQRKEKVMNAADMLVYVHPELDMQARSRLEKRIMGCVGVAGAEFDHHPHPHAMIVKYDSDEIQGMEIVNIVRTVDPVASRVGL